MKLLTSILALSLCSAIEAAAVVKRSAGCGVQHDFVGSTRGFTVQSGGRTRRFNVHLPSNYNAAADTGVVIAYHGADGNPEGFEGVTRFSNTTVNPNLIAVYPAGVAGYWQGPSYATAGVKDDVFTSDMVDFLQDTFCVDPARIYATGHSNGGGFVGLLACSADHGGQFAAFAPVSAALYTDLSGDDNCSPQRSPMPILEFHSRDDGTIPYLGGPGRGGPLPSITDWLSRWVRRNGCRTPSVTTLPSGTKRHVWGCGSKERNQQHYEHLHEGHSWPRTEVDASVLIIEYLLTQKKPIYN